MMATSGMRETGVTRIVLSGGQVFDGTGAEITDGDIVIEDGQILDVGTGLDGDEQLDVSGLHRAAGLHRLPCPCDQLRGDWR